LRHNLTPVLGVFFESLLANSIRFDWITLGEPNTRDPFVHQQVASHEALGKTKGDVTYEYGSPTNIPNANKTELSTRIQQWAIRNGHIPLKANLDSCPVTQIIENAEDCPHYAEYQAQESGELRDSHLAKL
jgi:hypothetical protein